MRRARIVGTAVSITVAMLIVWNGSASATANRTYQDWSPDLGALTASEIPWSNTQTQMANAQIATPLPLTKGPDAPGGVGVVPPRTSRVHLDAGEPASPRVVRVDNNQSSRDFQSTWCFYIANRTANPPPPGSGDQYAMARTAGRNSWAQAFDSQGGSVQSPHTSTARTTFSVSINIPFDWPQPAQINGYANPSFLGGHAVLSRHSPLTLGQSSATSRNAIRFGAARDSSYNWLSLWDTSLTRGDGTEWLEYWTWPGLDDGYAFFVNIDATPAHVYHFNVETTTSATSRPIFGAPAAAQTDYGSAGIDAPSLGAGLHMLSNDFDDMAIEYLMPPGISVIC